MNTKSLKSDGDKGYDGTVEKLFQLTSHIPVPLCFINQSGCLVYANKAWHNFFTVDKESYNKSDQNNFIRLFSQNFAEIEFIEQFFLKCLRSSNNRDQYFLRSSPINFNRHAIIINAVSTAVFGERLWCWIFHDESEKVSLQNRLRESEERFQLAAQSSNDGLWDWHLKTDELYFSPRWLNMLGYSEEDFQNNLSDWLNLVHPVDKKELSKRLQEHLSKKHNRFRHEYRIQDNMGEYRWILIQGMLVLDENKEPHRFAGSQSDITEIKRMERQLIHDSTHDALTDLPNRILFREKINGLMQNCKDNPEATFALVQLNLDQFQLINNGLGHLFGDQVLTIVATRLNSLMTEQDVLARMSGDEFAILLTTAQTPETVGEFVAKLQNILAEPLIVNGQHIVLSAGMGIVIRNEEHTQVAQLLGDVATAMHHAKAMAPGSWILFTEEMRSHAINRIQLETKLRRAIEQKEMQVFFQPIIDYTTGVVKHFEALVRWFDPERGMIQPASFIPLAEETNLIIPLGEFVLRKSCQELMKWYAAGYKDIGISVNLSPKQFQQENLHERISTIIQETGIISGALTLEVTESQIMENPSHAIDVLNKLQALNVNVSVDDFGTGYSSLAYLKKLPINTLKIDL